MAARIPAKGDRDYDPARRPASPLSKRQAQALTDRIARAVDGLWALLEEAHEKRAWAPLGYASWEQYVRTEFQMSRGQAYRLLDQANVLRELGAAADVPAAVLDVSVRGAAAVKPVLETVAEEVREAVRDVPPEDRPAVVRDVLGEARKRPPAHAPQSPKQPAGPAAPDAVQPGLPVVLAAVLATPPEAAVRVDGDLWVRFHRWVDEAGRARTRAARTTPRRPESVPAGPCKHPINRRIGNRCAECGEPVR